jgi:monovalent cation/hydrogen antiporter
MVTFDWVVALLLGAVALSALARRIGVPYPSLLAVGGAALALAHGGLHFTLDPSLALALFVAPVLLDAAYDASLRDLRDNWAPLSSLVVVAVCLTAAAVAWVAHALRPEMAWPVAVVLGAVVAPPDAAAATAVLRQVQLPHRVLTVLEGESLLNDAVALLIYRFAIDLVTSPGASPAREVPLLVLSVVGSVAAGMLLGRALLRLIERVSHVPSSIVLQFVTTFGVWMLAERIRLSGVLTIVSYAITLARHTRMPARLRVPSYAVWDTAVFVLNALAFILIGLQIRPIMERLSPAERARDIGFAAAVLVVVVVVRIAWVMLFNTAWRWKLRRFGTRARRPLSPPTPRTGLLASWCGMRGIVTLAAALALTPTFPQRDLIVLTAFAVVVGSLLVQGLTLRPLVRLLRLRADDSVDAELQRAMTLMHEAALAAIEGDSSAEAEALRLEYPEALERLRSQPERALSRPLAMPFAGLRQRAVAAARATISRLRVDGEIGDDAYHVAEEYLDRIELAIAS